VSTTVGQGEPRITGLADLARYIEPDSPVDVVDVLVRLYHDWPANHETIAHTNPYAYLVYVTWDTMDHHPTATELREAVSAASRANPPAPAFRIDHVDIHLTWTQDPSRTERNTVPFADDDAKRVMYVEACDPRGSFCKGVTLYVRPPIGQDLWAAVHLPAPDAMILAGAIHNAFLHYTER
jgi:hypothetical protein